jgi:hypothetical protein
MILNRHQDFVVNPIVVCGAWNAPDLTNKLNKLNKHNEPNEPNRPNNPKPQTPNH